MNSLDTVQHLTDTPQVLLTVISATPLSMLLQISTTNKYLEKSVQDLLCLCVTEIVSYYLPKQTDTFIQLVARAHGVLTGYTLLDFVNGKWEDNPMERQQRYPLEIVMDNLAVQEAITFFVDMTNDDIPISIDNNIDPLMGTTCSQIVTIGNEEVSTTYS